MNKRAYILFLITLITATVFGQTKQVTCISSEPKRYTISGTDNMLFHWQVEGGKITSADTLNDTIFIQWDDEVGERILSVYGEYQGCFTDIKELMVSLLPTPNFSLGNDQEICEGDIYTFEVDTAFKNVVWHNNTKGRTYTTDTTEIVTANVTNSVGCEATDEALVTMHLRPEVDLGKDTFLCGSANLILDASNFGARYRWNVQDHGFDIVEPSITISKGAYTYVVEVTDVNNCSTIDSLNISKCPWAFNKDSLPGAFTPNGDGKNDEWKLAGLSDDYPNAVVQVYDRGGRLVFQSTKGLQEKWDGKNQMSGEILPMDNYFYVIDLNDDKGGTAHGTIMLIR